MKGIRIHNEEQSLQHGLQSKFIPHLNFSNWKLFSRNILLKIKKGKKYSEY